MMWNNGVWLCKWKCAIKSIKKSLCEHTKVIAAVEWFRFVFVFIRQIKVSIFALSLVWTSFVCIFKMHSSRLPVRGTTLFLSSLALQAVCFYILYYKPLNRSVLPKIQFKVEMKQKCNYFIMILRSFHLFHSNFFFRPCLHYKQCSCAHNFRRNGQLFVCIAFMLKYSSALLRCGIRIVGAQFQQNETLKLFDSQKSITESTYKMALKTISYKMGRNLILLGILGQQFNCVDAKACTLAVGFCWSKWVSG